MQINKFEELPIITLGSFGHNGLDWLHSLLDDHDQIILMPAFSFFRTLDFFKLQHGYDLLNLQSNSEIAQEFTNFIVTNPSYQVVRRKFIHSLKEETIFKTELINFLDETRLRDPIKKLFYGIHYAFSLAQGINILAKKVIVVQEHVSWHFFNYQKIFNKIKFIFMMRDPRASFAGGWKRQVENAGLRRLNPFDFDKMILAWTYANQFCISSAAKSDIKVMVNEKMHQNLKKEMQELCAWMNISFHESCLFESFMGKPWLGESAYLGIDELSERPPKNFYDVDQIENRWRSRLKKEDILMLESIFKSSMKSYDYDSDNHLSFYLSCKGYFIYATRNLTNQDESSNFLISLIKIVRNIFRRILIIISPNYASKIFLLP